MAGSRKPIYAGLLAVVLAAGAAISYAGADKGAKNSRRPAPSAAAPTPPPTAGRPPSGSEIPAFDWPPPTPSDKEVLPPDLLSRGHNLRHLGDVDQVLIAALSSTGFYDRSFWIPPQNGVKAIDTMHTANLWLGPIQALVSSALGVLFVSTKPKAKAEPDPKDHE
jgi:hypothetical protein